MAEPSFAIQKAVYQALTTANISGVGAKVFHRIPAGSALPYLEIGHDTIIGDDEAGEFFNAYVEVQAFARSMADLKPIVAAIYAALYRNVTLEGFTSHTFHHVSTRYLTEKVGSDLIENAVIEFEYLLQTAP